MSNAMDTVIQNIEQEISPSPHVDLVDPFNNSNNDSASNIVSEQTMIPDDNYVPETPENVVTEISPANFDNMTKILSVLSKENDDTIMIRDSIITQGNVDCIIQADMTQILKNKKGETINLDIINPKKYISMFTQFSSNNNIFIISDDENSRFVVTDGEIKLFLPKQDSILQQNIESFDISSAAETIAQFTVDKNERKIIKNLSKSSDYIEYLIKDKYVKGIHIPDTAIYIFPAHKKDSQDLNENNSDLTLRLNNFLTVEAEQYQISVVKDGEKYLSMVNCTVGGKIKVNTIESIDESDQGNLIF